MMIFYYRACQKEIRRQTLGMNLGLVICCWFPWLATVRASEPYYRAELIFPLHHQHNHAPGIAEWPPGTLLVSWYRGSGERTADDVAVYGACRRSGERQWSEPAIWADRPGFPDCNTCLMVDRHQRLWLFWPTIIANTWESCFTNYRVASALNGDGVPRWEQQDILWLKPPDFSQAAVQALEQLMTQLPRPLSERERQEIAEAREKLPQKLYQRLGWQPRCKPIILRSGRIVLPLYSDTFSLSLMAMSDDDGQTWRAGQPMLGFGAVQPTLFERRDGTLVALMRENGFTQRIRQCESTDGGETWGAVHTTEIYNPGSGLDGIVLHDGSWLLVYNDTPEGRHSLMVSLSFDEGRTWSRHRHLERQSTGRFHYPAVIQTRDGLIHVVYSYFVPDGKSMKHVEFNRAWVEQGDPPEQ